MRPRNFPERLRQRRLRAIRRTEGHIAAIRAEEARTSLSLTGADRAARLHALRLLIARHEDAIAGTLPKVGTPLRDVRTKKDRSANAKFRRSV